MMIKVRDEPESGPVPDSPADFQPDLSRIFQVFLLTFEHLFTMFFGFKLAF